MTDETFSSELINENGDPHVRIYWWGKCLVLMPLESEVVEELAAFKSLLWTRQKQRCIVALFA
jgi:hypothetical protein